MVLCILATDEEDENDVALQIHFTLIQAFCCDFDINILRVSGMKRLAQVLGESLTDSNANESKDLHCILVTVSVKTAFSHFSFDSTFHSFHFKPSRPQHDDNRTTVFGFSEPSY